MPNGPALHLSSSASCLWLICPEDEAGVGAWRRNLRFVTRTGWSRSWSHPTSVPAMAIRREANGKRGRPNQPNRRVRDPYARWCGRRGPVRAPLSRLGGKCPRPNGVNMPPDETRETLELKKLQVEITKTQAEIKDLEHSFFARPTSWIAIASAVIAIGGTLGQSYLTKIEVANSVHKVQEAEDDAKTKTATADKRVRDAELQVARMTAQRAAAEKEFAKLQVRINEAKQDFDRRSELLKELRAATENARDQIPGVANVISKNLQQRAQREAESKFRGLTVCGTSVVLWCNSCEAETGGKCCVTCPG
jgi:hypothetical protein